MRRALSVFGLASLSLTACTHPTGSAGDSPPPSTATESTTDAPGEPSRTPGRVLATVMTRDARVSIVGGGATASDELRFVVRRSDGTIVADGISAQELRATDPLLHSIVTSAVAGADSGGAKTKASYIDATLTLPHHASDQTRW